MSLNDLAWFRVMGAWVRSTESCSATSHALMYSIMAATVLISVGGVFVWRRFIRTQPLNLMNKRNVDVAVLAFFRDSRDWVQGASGTGK